MQNVSTIIQTSKSKVESIPLPFASVAFTDGYHSAIMKNLGINRAILMFARPQKEFYIASSVGFSQLSVTHELELSSFCKLISNDLIKINGSTLNTEFTTSHLPQLSQAIIKSGYNFFRVYQINDFLASEGYWLMFFKSLDEANVIGKIIKHSFYSPQFRDVITDKIKASMGTDEIDEIITNWVTLLDKRDKETEAHTIRVAQIAIKLARKLGLAPEAIQNLRRGALLHDIGKLVIPNEILFKPGPLSDPEWRIMEMHPKIVKDLLQNFTVPDEVLEVPYSHHEKWDGSGYPEGLGGEEIPYAARIFALVDVFDALVSDRPYRPRFSQEDALDYIRAQSGKHFDPKIVPLFISLVEELQLGISWVQ
jgi:putative nucleotidyltransferase with HDIG domain